MNPFWVAQPEPVRAVLNLANDADTEAVHGYLRTFGQAVHADAIDDLRTDLGRLAMLRDGDPRDALTAYYDRGKPWRGINPDYVADALADELQADVLARAQLIASLIVGRVAA